MENKEFKKVCVKNISCYYFDDMFKLNDFYLNVLLDE